MPPIRRRAISHQNKPITETQKVACSKAQRAGDVAAPQRSWSWMTILPCSPSLARLIQAAGFRVLTFDRPSALLASESRQTTRAWWLI